MKKLITILSIFIVIQFGYMSCASTPQDVFRNARLEKTVKSLNLKVSQLESSLDQIATQTIVNKTSILELNKSDLSILIHLNEMSDSDKKLITNDDILCKQYGELKIADSLTVARIETLEAHHFKE